MPRTEKSAAWSKQKRIPESHKDFDDSEAAELAVQYGPRCAVLISNTQEMERALSSDVPLSFLVQMSFGAPPATDLRAA